MKKISTLAVCLWIGCAGAIFAQTSPQAEASVVRGQQNDMRGHWTGSIDVPQVGPIGFEFDLDEAASGWIGTLSIPLQGASGIPLDAIAFADGKGSFRLKGAPGDPTYTGTLSADGKTLDGTLTQQGQSIPLKLTRTGEAKVEMPKASPAVAAQFVGKWEGTVDFGQPLRLVLNISNEADGAHATLVSLDQGNAQIPVTTIGQQDTKLSLIVKAVGGDYEGELNAQGDEIKGTWSQMGNGVPLVLKKAAQ